MNTICEGEFRLMLTTLSQHKSGDITFTIYRIADKIVLEQRREKAKRSNWYLMDESVLWTDFYAFIIKTKFKNEKTHL